MRKFTFKKHPRKTGLSAVGYTHQDVDIKVDRKKVGYISAPTWQTTDSLWRVRFAEKMEPTKERPAPFKWVQMKATFESETKAREWLQKNANAIQSKFNMHQFED